MIEKHEENDVYDDYRLLSIEVDTLAKLRISEIIDSDSGEMTPLTPTFPHPTYSLA